MLKKKYIEDKIESLDKEIAITEDENIKDHLRSLKKAYYKEYDKAKDREEPQVGMTRYSYSAPRTGKNLRSGYDFY